jgi:predicted nucleic acid-binding protein
LAGYVLDTSAVMAVLLDESGAAEVRTAVYGSGHVLLPFIALMEIEYKLLQRKPEIAEASLSILGAWPVEVAESNYAWRRRAARVKSESKLSLGDAWIASLALIIDAELIHKDPEFDAVASLKHLRLPYTQPTRRRGRS